MSAPDEAPNDVVRLTTGMLAELNRELDARFPELPPDVQAILVQKGALTQCATRELGHTLDRCSAMLELYDDLVAQCRAWRENFMNPLLKQCDGKTIENPVYATDLERVLGEVDALISRADSIDKA